MKLISELFSLQGRLTLLKCVIGSYIYPCKFTATQIASSLTKNCYCNTNHIKLFCEHIRIS